MSSMLILLAVPVALFGLQFRSRMSTLGRRIWIGALVVAIGFAAVQLATIALHNVRDVPTWDFLGFWLYAHIAAAHQNVYDSSFARALVAPFTVSAEFRREIIDTGFWYPPGSILIFLPLAAFANVHAAYAVWYVIQGAALVGAVIALARAFLRDDGAEGILVVAVLTLALPAAAETVLYGQTNFLLLLGIALFWQAKDRLAGGAWLGAAILVKPFAAALALALLLRRRFAPLGGALGTLAVASLGAAVLLGFAASKSYLSGGPYHKLPVWVYTESTNQSLLGVLMRATHAAATGSMHVPTAYVLAALVLVLATAWFCLRAERSADDLALALCLVLGLLIYPTSQTFYAVVLVVPMLVVWQRRHILPWQSAGCIVFIALLYVIMRARHETLVAAYMLLWFALAALTVSAPADAPAFASVIRRAGEKGALAAVFTVVAVLLIGRDAARPTTPFLAPVGLDFRAFYCAGYVVDRGADPYRVEPLRACEHRFQPAVGWPDTLVVPAPLPGFDLAFLGALARLPYAVAKDAWYLGTFALLLVVIAILRRLSGLPLATVFLALFFVDWSEPYLYGQLPPLAVGALCCAAAFMTSRRYVAAAVAAAASMLEPHLGLPACLAMFVWLPRTRVPLAACALALAVISALTIGPALSVEYLTHILPVHAASELVATDQFSLSHMAHIAGVGDATALALGSISYLAMTVIGVFLARRVALATRTAAFIVLLPPAVALLGGPFLHALQFAAAIPAIVLLAAKANRWRPAAWTALALIALPWFSLSPNAGFHDRSTLQVLGEQLLAFAAVLTFALSAAREMPRGARRVATFAGILAVFVLLIGVAHLPRLHIDRPSAPLPAAALEPGAEASANWAAYLRADPTQSTLTPQMEFKKIPFWIGILLLIGVASGQIAARRVEPPVTQWRRPAAEAVAPAGRV